MFRFKSNGIKRNFRRILRYLGRSRQFSILQFHLIQLQRAGSAKERLRYKWKRRHQIAAAARCLVTPFSGYLLCDLYLSSEIDEGGLRWMNREAKRVSRRRVQKSTRFTIFYCQVDELEVFATKYLPEINRPFLLISGKWNLPSLEDGPWIEELCNSAFLVAWWSQNQELDDSRILPFPYGVRLESAPEVLRVMTKPAKEPPEFDVYVPFAVTHGHLKGSARRLRISLGEYMDEPLPLQHYLEKIKNSRIVVSPLGDRPDTYRHWETIALGAVPACIPHPALDALFAGRMYMSSDVIGIINRKFKPEGVSPDPTFATLEYWRCRLMSQIAQYQINESSQDWAHRGSPSSDD